jgi:hypothetical protein
MIVSVARLFETMRHVYEPLKERNTHDNIPSWCLPEPSETALSSLGADFAELYISPTLKYLALS